jgi:hypothetical protein
MKQTAVEWLADKLTLPEYGDNPQWVQDAIEQAKQMEKKQMKKAYNHERPNLLCYEKGTAFKEYYNETFKTKQND